MVFGRPDDPMEVLSKIQLAKIGEKLWNEEEIKPEEIPQGLQEEIRESGAITVALRDVRTSIGKDRQQWKLALEAELQSLRDTGAIATVKHVPRNKQILPMKVVLTLKPQPGLTTKKKKARVCVCGNFQQKKPTDLFYTANTDVSSIRVVLAEAACRLWCKQFGCGNSFPQRTDAELGGGNSLCQAADTARAIRRDSARNVLEAD